MSDARRLVQKGVAGRGVGVVALLATTFLFKSQLTAMRPVPAKTFF